MSRKEQTNSTQVILFLAKMSAIKIIVIFLPIFFENAYACSYRNAGVNSANSLASGMRESSDKLKAAMEKGAGDVKEAVNGMSTSISDLAKKVSVTVDSKDFANVGQAASENLRDAVAVLSQNWKLAVNTADLKVRKF